MNPKILTVEDQADFVELLDGNERRTAVSASGRAVIRPGVVHHVAPQGEVEFTVEFWRRGTPGAG